MITGIDLLSPAPFSVLPFAWLAQATPVATPAATPVATPAATQAQPAQAPAAAGQSRAVGMPPQADAVATPATASPTTTGVPGAAPAPAGTPQGGGLFSSMPLLLLLAFGIMFIPMILSGRKESKKKAALLASIRKGDRVQTAGGIIGTVADINQDDLVLRMEEGRIRFAKSAIVGVLKSANFGKPEDNKADQKADQKGDQKTETGTLSIP